MPKEEIDEEFVEEEDYWYCKRYSDNRMDTEYVWGAGIAVCQP